MNRPIFSLNSRRLAQNHGFSLVEIVIALGVLSFAIVPILGVLSVGLTQSAENTSVQVTNQIMRQVTARAQQMKFSDLSNLRVLYFDSEAVEVATASEALWRATPTVATPPSVASNPSKPEAVIIENPKHLVRVEVKTDFIPDGTPVPGRTETDFFYLSNRGR